MPKQWGLWVVGLVVVVGCEWVPFGQQRDEPPTATSPAQPVVRVTDPGVLAVVNGRPITTERFRQRVDALADDHPSGFMTQFGSARLIHRKPKTAEERRLLLDELIKEELVVQDAIALGLERDPTVKRRLEETKRLVLLDALTRRQTESIVVENQEVEDYYNRFQAAFKEPERIRVRQIVTRTLQEAEAIRATTFQGGDFAQLAREQSIGAGREQGGDVGWYLRQLDLQLLQSMGGQEAEAKTFFEQLEPVAFALQEVGQISQPVKGPEGYYLVKLEERQATKPKPLSEVWNQIHDGLLIQKRQQSLQDQLDRLWKKAQVELNEQRLESL